MRDSRTMIDQVEFFEPPTESQRELARRTVAAGAVGDTHAERVADAELLLQMLGLHPSQDDEDDPQLKPSPMITANGR